ncbi:AAA family ATPase [Blastochloris sulfoviridis]|uniref:AAA family ATPase n=1 Tax=Blastochloris sulfoviridis TaxID=50712 RepID=UPI001AEE0A53
MILESFRVTNFRSINSSGDIKVSRITALLGRNESGKSNLLRALQSLNPVDGFAALNPIKDFPRHRCLEECKPDTRNCSARCGRRQAGTGMCSPLRVRRMASMARTARRRAVSTTERMLA